MVRDHLCLLLSKLSKSHMYDLYFAFNNVLYFFHRINLLQTCTVFSQKKATMPATSWWWVKSASQQHICVTFFENPHSCRVTGTRSLYIDTKCSACVPVALRSSSWLPQKVSHCFGECPTNHPRPTRYNPCKHALLSHTHPTCNSTALLFLCAFQRTHVFL